MLPVYSCLARTVDSTAIFLQLRKKHRKKSKGLRSPCKDHLNVFFFFVWLLMLLLLFSLPHPIVTWCCQLPRFVLFSAFWLRNDIVRKNHPVFTMFLVQIWAYLGPVYEILALSLGSRKVRNTQSCFPVRHFIWMLKFASNVTEWKENILDKCPIINYISLKAQPSQFISKPCTK